MLGIRILEIEVVYRDKQRTNRGACESSLLNICLLNPGVYLASMATAHSIHVYPESTTVQLKPAVHPIPTGTTHSTPVFIPILPGPLI